MFESIELLKNSSLWVPCKRNNSDNSHFYPCNPENGEEIEEAILCTYEQALSAVQQFNLDCVMFYFSHEYIGVHIGNAFSDDGTLEPLAEEIINLLDSYTEYTSAGNSLTIICKKSMPLIKEERWPYNHEKLYLLVWNGIVELTFKSYGIEKEVRECNDEIETLIEKYIRGGLHWRKFGSHYKCDLENGISLWCFYLQKDSVIPFIVNPSMRRWRIDPMTALDAREVCISWRDELANFDYDYDTWLESRKKP